MIVSVYVSGTEHTCYGQCEGQRTLSDVGPLPPSVDRVSCLPLYTIKLAGLQASRDSLSTFHAITVHWGYSHMPVCPALYGHSGSELRFSHLRASALLIYPSSQPLI